MRSADLWPRIKAGIVALMQADPTLSLIAGGIKSQLLTDTSNIAFPHVVATYDATGPPIKHGGRQRRTCSTSGRVAMAT